MGCQNRPTVLPVRSPRDLPVMSELLVPPTNWLHIAACFFLILVVLIQPGKGGGLGAFGGAGAQQVFGSRGGGNWLTKLTWWTAATFFCTSLALAYFSSSTGDSLESQSELTAPASPGTPPVTPPKK